MSITITTLGDIKRWGGDLSLYCDAPRCRRQLDVTLDKLIDTFGVDTEVIGKRWPVRCRVCGGKKIGMIYSPIKPRSGHPAPTWGMMPPTSTRGEP